MNSLAIGTQVQRKGSNVIWTVKGINPEVGSARLYLTCTPRNRSEDMCKWISLESFQKNWVVVSPTRTKTFTVIYKGGQLQPWEFRWAQVKVSAHDYMNLLEEAHKAAEEIGRKHHLYSWKLEDRISRELKSGNFDKERIS